MIEQEFRKIENKLNSIEEKRTITGYALVFNSLSENLGGFREQIEPDSLTGVIEKSDVFAYLNHDKSRGVLARSKKGSGTLKLTIDEIGLKYEFESPATSLGDELIEMVKRGDIDSSSFVFTVEKDKWEKQSNGSYIRTIIQFGELFDISPVYQPAYESTSVQCKRFLEIQDSEIEISTEIIEEVEIVNDDIKEEIEIVEEVNEENIIELVENIVDENINDEIEQPIELTERNLEINSENNEINKEIKKEKRMENFKLITAINNVVNNRNLSEVEQEVINAGKSEMRKTGLNFTGQIQLPTEQRDINASTVGQGIENVSEQKLNILGPLYADLVLAKAGAQFLTGLVGDVSIPTYSGSAVLWKGETAEAGDGAGSFGEVTLKPKRLTATIDISKQFLEQDSNSAEAMLMNDITNAIGQKLESTILGNVSGADQPTGLFYGTGVTSGLTVSYSGITALEGILEDKNVKNYKFIVNPKAKVALKSAKKTEGKMIFEDNELDGIETYSTANMVAKGVLIGDFSDLVIGQWGSIDLIVDPYTQASNGKVRLVINAYFDAKVRRDSFVKAILA